MKKILSILISLFLTTACITTRAISQPAMTDMQASNQEKEVSQVIAVNAVYLRDMPEEYGGMVIGSMPRGSQFVVKTCLTVYTGTKWAYGDYVTDDGIIHGWAAYRYISGGCDD